MDYGYSYISGVRFDKYEVLKETKKGFWIARIHGYPSSWIKKISNKECRFVLKGKGKRFANLTKEEALKSLLHRAYARRRILSGQQENNEATIKFAESELERTQVVT